MNPLTHMVAGSPLATLRPFLAQLPDSFWMPAQASTNAGEVDTIFYVIYWISLFFFAIIVGLMALFVVRYRARRPGDAAEKAPTHSTRLEITWTVIPILISAALFVLGFKSYLNLTSPPRNAYEISVTGQKWQWFFAYPNGFVTDELHVPVDRPVRLTMTSEDVIHSLWIPAFRVKKDVVPGRYTRTWFEANEAGTYPLLCTEYCGTGHSDMLSTVTVHESGMFENWLQAASNLYDTMPPAEAGEMLVQRTGCVQCHSLDGKNGIGPTFQNLYGHEFKLTNGNTVVAEDNYIRQSILEPMADIVMGYEPVMPTYAGKLKDSEITYIITYLKSNSDRGGLDEAAEAEAISDESPAGEESSATEVE